TLGRGTVALGEDSGGYRRRYSIPRPASRSRCHLRLAYSGRSATNRLTADIVAKRFFASRRATLIQKIDPPRNIDSSGAPVGFESCALGGPPTFATKSADRTRRSATASPWSRMKCRNSWREGKSATTGNAIIAGAPPAPPAHRIAVTAGTSDMLWCLLCRLCTACQRRSKHEIDHSAVHRGRDRLRRRPGPRHAVHGGDDELQSQPERQERSAREYHGRQRLGHRGL